SSNQAIWQGIVEPTIQGRVSAARRMVAWSTLPLAYAVAGPLTDYVFNPLAVSLSRSHVPLSFVLGSGAGRGIGLLFVAVGIVMLAVASAGYLYAPLRRIDDGVRIAASCPKDAVAQAETA